MLEGDSHWLGSGSGQNFALCGDGDIFGGFSNRRPGPTLRQWLTLLATLRTWLAFAAEAGHLQGQCSFGVAREGSIEPLKILQVRQTTVTS